jgi:site-specific DNA-adenine methylase
MKPVLPRQINAEWKRRGRGQKYKDSKIGGYPGLSFTASRIAEYIPPCNIFVEPFAGLGRISPLVKANIKVLNDKNPVAYSYNKSNKFENYIVTCEDFLECIKKYDDENNILFIDPPWSSVLYEDAFIDRKPRQYYEELLKLVPTLKSHWFICSDKAESQIAGLLSKSGYPMIVLESKKKILGNTAKVRIISNK